jgi:hypothetical protein
MVVMKARAARIEVVGIFLNEDAIVRLVPR